MELRDSIPLKAIDEHGVLGVPGPLSRETALRLIKRGLVCWYQVEYTKHGKLRGFVKLSRAGKKAVS